MVIISEDMKWENETTEKLLVLFTIQEKKVNECCYVLLCYKQRFRALCESGEILNHEF